MKKIFGYLYLCIMLFSSCRGGEYAEGLPNVTPLRHLMVEGKPFLMLGAQLRTDYFMALDGRSADDLHDYFKLAADMNIMVIQVPVSWRDVEKTKDQYNGALIERFIQYCEQYQMKLEILWFGSYMCGYSVEGYIPDYVVNDTKTYPELKKDAAFDGWLGKHYYLKPNTEALVDRERKAIEFMMNVIYNYDNANGKRHTVIGIQIENEADMLATRHNDAHGFTPEQIWPDLIKMLDRLGQVVKNSPYKCFTRTNLTTTSGNYIKRSEEIVATKGIDYVGLDPYENKISQIEMKLTGLRWIKGNYSHIAENGGEYANNDLLMLKAVTMGCGYEIFEVITTPNPMLEDWTLRGVYQPNFSPRWYTQRIVDAFKIFKHGWVDLAEAPISNILGFNLKTDDGAQSASEEQKTKSATISWTTTDRGVAYAVESGGYITVSSTKADAMEFKDVTVTSVENGYYNLDREWVSQGVVTLTDNTLAMQPCVVYRVNIQK